MRGPSFAVVLFLLSTGLSGCTSASVEPAWHAFEAIYEDEQGGEYLLALDGPHVIADSFGVPREAYRLHVDGAGVHTPTTIHLDGDLRVVRVDRVCMDGAACRYDQVQFADVRTPAPFGIGLSASQTVVVDVYGNLLEEVVKAAPVGDEDGLLLSMEIPRAAGISVVGRWVPHADSLAPSTVFSKWPARPAGVELQLAFLEQGEILPTIDPWPTRPADPSMPGEVTGLLEERWLGHDWTPADALEALLQQSELAIALWDADGCVTQIEVDGPANVDARGVSGGNESPGAARFALSDRDGQAAEFHLQYGGDILLDEVQGRSWRVTNEQRLADPGSCAHAPSADQAVVRWHETVDDLAVHAQATAMASVSARWQPGTPHPIPAEWSHTASFLVLQPEHVEFEPNTVTSWTPYTVERDGNGALIEVVLHPDDRAALDDGAWAAALS